MLRIIRESEPQLINFLIIVMDSDQQSVCCHDSITVLNDMFILEQYICFSLIKLIYSYPFKKLRLLANFDHVPINF